MQGGMAVWWLALSAHSNKVLGLNQDWRLAAWQLLPQHKELHGVTMGNLRCECERRLNTKNIKLLDTDIKKE